MFDVLHRFQENKVFRTAQTMINILKSNTKWKLCHHGNCDLLNWKFRKIPVGFNHSNYVVKTHFFKKGQSDVNINYLLQQHTKLF